jgi:hypothetical protein
MNNYRFHFQLLAILVFATLCQKLHISRVNYSKFKNGFKIVMLNIVMLNKPKVMLNKPKVMLNKPKVMLNKPKVMLNIVMLNIVMLNIVMLNFITFNRALL